ncbi:hypothetical protein QJS04_geneDACA012485 [Acorus gramineus]|uniref:Mitochondrial import inner membrane translocase subunit Tim21 n=1 Tax=Acorus gramineus TaxID=55184 RepID=A0AAV9BBQ1_ACOGR|nr:hypothetical protein QJS04_geneDACA012485 [Acorus gramineus]
MHPDLEEMFRLKHKTSEICGLIRNSRWSSISPAVVEFSSVSTAPAKPVDAGRIESITKATSRINGIPVLFGGPRQHTVTFSPSNQFAKYHGQHHTVPCFVRTFASNPASQSSQKAANENAKKDISVADDPFDTLTYNIPEKPVTFVEGASYSVVILAGLALAALAAYAAFKELIFEPKEYKIFGRALERVQNDGQVRVRIGSPITGYGQESRNRSARQHIPNRTWTDEDGVERIEINFHIRGPQGVGKVFAEMFKDKADKNWKFTYLIVEIRSPSPVQLILESYVPSYDGAGVPS